MVRHREIASGYARRSLGDSRRRQRRARAYAQSPFNEVQGVVSPDGRWLAYASDESGRYRDLRRLVSDAGDAGRLTSGGGGDPRWNARWQRDLLPPRHRDPCRASGVRGALPEATASDRLFDAGVEIRAYDAAPDGQRFLLNLPAAQTETRPISVIVNWRPLMRTPVQPVIASSNGDSPRCSRRRGLSPFRSDSWISIRAMTRPRLLLLISLISLGTGSILFSGSAATQGPATAPPGSTYKGRAFTFNKIKDGVYHAIGTGSIVVMSNATIVEGDTDVLVVDSHVSPGGAWALRKELAAVTLEADPIRRQQPLPLRSFARQSDLRPRGRHHRPRIRARDDPGRQVAGLAGARVLRRRHSQHHQDAGGAAQGRDRRQDARDDSDAARDPAQSPRGHQRREADAAERDAHAER